jgi:hypothetical protein
MAGLALSEDKASQDSKAKLATPPAAQSTAPAVTVKATADYPVIGYLEKRDRTITIKAGPKGPLYSVKTADGKVLCENLSKEQLTAQVPELADFLKTAVAGTAGAKTDARVRVWATVGQR